ncbi:MULTISPECIES: hypothetical protein [unclassified Microcoleus]
MRFEICELVRTIVVSSIGQELHDFWELVFLYRMVGKKLGSGR